MNDKKKNMIAAVKCMLILFVIFYAVFYIMLSISSGQFADKGVIIASVVMGAMTAFVVFNFYLRIMAMKNKSKK